MLIGMAGAGKSTTGRILAKLAGLKFIDIDEYIREKDGARIQEIIDKQGDNALVDLEARRIREIELRQTVAAPGGSIVYHEEAMEYLRERCVVVFLDEGFENIEERVKKTPDRGVVGLRGRNLRQVFDERRPLYLRYADMVVEPAGRSPTKVAEEILEKWAKGYLDSRLDGGG